MTLLAEATTFTRELTAFLKELGPLLMYLAPLASGVAVWYSRRSVVETKAGNVDAAIAASAATAAAAAAATAATKAEEASDKVEAHAQTTAILIEKGIERGEFERAMAIGEAKARSDMMPLSSGGK